MGCLYLIESPSGKKYIGITAQPLLDRWRAHRSHANRNIEGALQRAIRKYGAKNMSVKTLVIANDYEYLKQLEISAISTFDTKVPNGYNMTDGGDGVLGVIVTEEGRKRRSTAQKKAFQDEGRKKRHIESQNTQELKDIRSKNQTLKVSNIEYRENLSKMMKAKWLDPSFISKMANREFKPRINDGLDKSQRYRIKDLEAYRERKREYAKTEEQKLKRTEYMRKYRELNREKTNEQARVSHNKSKAKQKAKNGR